MFWCVVAAALHNNFGGFFYAVSVQRRGQGSSTRNQFSVAERSIFQEMLLQCISYRPPKHRQFLGMDTWRAEVQILMGASMKIKFLHRRDDDMLFNSKIRFD